MSVLAESTMDLSVVDTKTPAQTATDYIDDDGTTAKFGGSFASVIVGDESRSNIKINGDSINVKNGNVPICSFGEFFVADTVEDFVTTKGMVANDKLCMISDDSELALADPVDDGHMSILPVETEVVPYQASVGTMSRRTDAYNTESVTIQAISDEKVARVEVTADNTQDSQVVSRGLDSNVSIIAKNIDLIGLTRFDSSKIESVFKVVSVPVISSEPITAEGYKDGTMDISNRVGAGYYPIGVVGTNATTRYFVMNRAYLTNKSNGGATLNWMVANHHSSAHTASVTCYILCIKCSSNA